VSEPTGRAGGEPPGLGRRVDEACNRFEAAWRAGETPRLEDFVAGWAGAERAALLRELVPLDADYRRLRGEPWGAADYLARFPDLDPSCLGNSLDAPVPMAAATVPPRETLLASDPSGGVRSFGDFEGLEEIARGGMGVVYRARQRRLNRVVALKMILAGEFASPDAVQRFCDEAKNVARLDHPHIVPVYEVGEHNGLPFFSMKYIDGSSLLHRPPATPRAAAELMAKVARAVHHAHQRGILHRDIKPGNILLDAAGEPYVTDFGLAKHVEAATAHTLSGAVVGTPSYMAPEQARGHSKRLTTVADVYGLGAVLYELLSGQPPFKGETALDTLQQVLTREPVPPSGLRPGVPRDLEVISLKCLRKEPEGRYESALALADDLERFLAGEAIQARAVGRAERVARWVRRHPAAAGLVVVSALAALALVGVGVSQWYTTQLEASKNALEESNAKLEESNARLEATSEELKLTLAAVRAEKWKKRQYYYATQMMLVERARQEKQNARVVQLLRSVIPEGPDEEDPRNFEWFHLWRQYNGEKSRLRGHKGAVTAVAFSPDDRLIASGSADHTVKLWDAGTGKEVRSLDRHKAGVTALAFSPDRKRLATASSDRTVRIWDSVTGQELHCFNEHDGAVNCVAFSPDGRHVASGSDDMTVRLWAAETGEVERKFTGHRHPVKAVAFSLDAIKMASVGQGPKGELLVWNTSTGDIALENRGTSWTSVAFCPDGQHLATGEAGAVGTEDGKRAFLKPAIRIWDLGTKTVKSLKGHQDAITQVAFSPDGTQVVSSGADQTVRLWDVADGKEVATFHEEMAALGAAFSPDGRRFVSGSADHTVKVWALPGNALRTLNRGKGRINNVEFSPDGSRIAGAFFGRDVVIWDAISGKESLRLEGMGMTDGRVAWSPEGKYLASGLAVWDSAASAMKQMDASPARSGQHYAGAGTAFSRDGKFFATVASFQAVNVWDVATGRRLHELRTATDFCVCVAFSADGRQLVVGSVRETPQDPETLQIWDLTTGQVSLTPGGYLYGVLSVAFSPDGKWLAAAVGDYLGRYQVGGEVRIWDATNGQQVYNLRGHSACVWSVAFSPDGKRLASASGYRTKKEPGEVKIWDMQTGQELCTLWGHTGAVYGVSFSPDGRRLATAGEDGTVKIWDGTPLASAPEPERD
jgi:WD40 repeat protein/predicted Ser/Thr protein kinase